MLHIFITKPKATLILRKILKNPSN